MKNRFPLFCILFSLQAHILYVRNIPSMGPIWLAFSGFLWLMLVLFHRSSPPTTEEDSRGSFPGRNPDPSSSHLESDDDGGSPLGAPEQKDTQSDVRLFHKYMKLHNKTYRFGSQEYFTRYENFLATLSRRSSLLSGSSLLFVFLISPFRFVG